MQGKPFCSSMMMNYDMLDFCAKLFEGFSSRDLPADVSFINLSRQSPSGYE